MQTIAYICIVVMILTFITERNKRKYKNKYGNTNFATARKNADVLPTHESE